MKHFIILLLLICNNLNSKLQAQENENHQETFAKFIITNGTVNGEDITPRLINEKPYFVIYRIIKTNDLCMANFCQTSNSQSSGSIYSILKKRIEANDENYQIDTLNFKWDYSNTYDEVKGTANVELSKVFTPEGVYFTMNILPENSDVLVYKGYMEETNESKVIDLKNDLK